MPEKGNGIPKSKRGPGQENAPWPDPLDFNAFQKALVEKPRPIVANLLDNCSRLIIGGGSKTYKTWALTDLAICISTGTPWWNFVTYQARVLYINFELKEYYFRKRISAILHAKRLQVDNDKLFVWNLRNYHTPLAAFRDELLKTIDDYGIEVVFIDPFYKLLGTADERISAELIPTLTMLEEINRMSSASIACAAHHIKGNLANRDPIDRISGGGSLARNPDNLITITKHKQRHAFSVDVICRDHPPIDSFVVEWKFPLLVRNTELDPSDIETYSANGNGSKQEYSVDSILRVLHEHDDEFSAKSKIQAIVSDETGMSKSTFYNLWGKLERCGDVFKSKASGNWNEHSNTWKT